MIMQFIQKVAQIPDDQTVVEMEKLVAEIRDKASGVVKQERAKQEVMEEEQKSQSKVLWTKDELVLLSKAIVKFPGGTPARW
jgi:hypothetical protein